MNEDGIGYKGVLFWTFLSVGLIALVLLLILFVFPPISRYQSRQDRNQHRTQALKDANNEVTINSIRIRTFEQKVKIAQQQANIRFINATGVRRAQDEIAKTLTPLYVQFEMVDALRQVALSGRNATVWFVPTGSSGLPTVVPTAPAK